MALRGKASQRRHRFALAAGGQEQELRGRNPVDIGQRDGDPVRHVEGAELARGPEVFPKAAADDGHAASELCRHADQVLDAMDVGSEIGDHDARRRLGEDLLERGVKVALGA